MMWRALGFAVVLAGVAGPAAAQQFDLECTGTQVLVLDGPEQPYEYGFRVDLDAGRWCWRSCERTFEIVEIAPDAIVFLRSSEQSYARRSYVDNRVSRITGEHEQVWIETRPVPTYLRIHGQCEVAEFSGFPQARF